MKGIVKKAEFMTVPNKGNLVTRRAFAERDGGDLNRVRLLAKVTSKAMSTAYQMTEEVGLYGSGTPSPAHVMCELVRALVSVGADTEAFELADCPRIFLSQLKRGDIEGDAVAKMNHLLKAASDANFLLAGRTLSDLPLGQLKDLSELVMTFITLGSELGWMIDAQAKAREESFEGVPIQREQLRETG